MLIQEIILPTILMIYLGFLTPLSKTDNILAIIPYSGKSHFIVMQPLLKQLAQKGHNVTVVSTYPLKKPMTNYVDLDVSHIIPVVTGSFSIGKIKEDFSTSAKVCDVIWDIGWNLCDKMYKDRIFENLLNTTFKYDLLITEIFSTDCFLPFAHKLDVPVVSIVTSVPVPWTNERIGNPDNPSYIANYYSSYGDKMSFYQRLENTIVSLRSKVVNHFIADNTHYEMVKKYFDESLPPLEEIARQRTSLVLSNSYFSVNQPRPAVPNFIEVGGIHLQQPKPLQPDLQDLLDKANDGFIFFSLGSLFKGSSVSQDKIDVLLKSFSKLPQLVLWKFEEDLPGTPPNVIINKWWPQNDILVHKNIKVFITHGGLSSTIEVINAGVPVLGIPIFADQPGNINNLVRKGAGIRLDYDDITFGTLNDALIKLTNDKSYMENAKKISRQFKDRPLSALDNAVFWVEYVLRHKGAYHMRSAATDLPLYQYLLLDIITFIIAILFISIFIVYKITKMFYSFLFNKNKKIRKNITKKIQ